MTDDKYRQPYVRSLVTLHMAKSGKGRPSTEDLSLLTENTNTRSAFSTKPNPLPTDTPVDGCLYLSKESLGDLWKLIRLNPEGLLLLVTTVNYTT